jgi:hypothetical protein
MALATAIACSTDSRSRCASSAGSGEAGSAGGDSAGGGQGGESGEGAAGNESWRLRALTYNAALAPGFEPKSAERQPEILKALKIAAQQLDVMCVQELWQASDFTQLFSATAQSLPNALHAPPRPGTGLCGAAELGSIGSCVQGHCASARTSPITTGCASLSIHADSCGILATLVRIMAPASGSF